jgi:Tfp pilus assembly protein PilV
MHAQRSGKALALSVGMANRADDGSTLVEVLVATLVLVTGVLGVAQLFLTAAATNAAARDTTIATTLAAQKVEQLLSTDLQEATGLIEHIDVWGQVVATAESPPANAVYTRRWSIEALSADTVAIRVRVGRSNRAGGSRPVAGETRVLAVKPRPRS